MTYIDIQSRSTRITRLIVSIAMSVLLVACGGGVTGDANNFVVVEDQTLVNLQEITIASAKLERTLCVVIYDSSILFPNKKGMDVIGEKTLEAGEYSDIKVALFRESHNNESMFVELHEGACASDSDVTQTADSIVTQGAISAVRFIAGYSTEPFVAAEEQTVNIRNEIIVKKIVSNGSAWVVLHRYDADAENGLGEIVNFQPSVTEGHHSNVAIGLERPLTAKDDFVVTLYANVVELSREEDRFDQANDALIPGAISAPFTVFPAP
ncbi:MAG TPA: hypothetical protein ENK06_08460 [Gammaproteobacteria bacterium]|nr:hypothetical protein [Gammaproteobacteria bacterium]